MKEQEVYVKVSVEDELPDSIADESYHVECSDGITCDWIASAFWLDKDWADIHSANGNEVQKEEITHWLKPTTGILLTKEDLVKLTDEAMTAGKIWAETYQGWFMPTVEQNKEKFEDFLKSKGLL